MTDAVSKEQLAEFTENYQRKKASFKEFHGLKKEVVFEKGARFFYSDKKDKDGKPIVMFAYKSSAVAEFVSKATDEQKAAWPKEWAAFRGLKPRKD